MDSKSCPRRHSLVCRNVLGVCMRGSWQEFFYQVVAAVKENSPIKVPEDQFGNVTFAGDVAVACLVLLERGKTGIWNVAGPDPLVRRCDFARRIAGISNVVILVRTEDSEQPARRPVYGGLNIGKLETEMPGIMREWVPPELAES